MFFVSACQEKKSNVGLLTFLLLEVVEVFSLEDVDDPDDLDDEDPESDSEEDESLDDDLCLARFSSFFASLPLRPAASTALREPLLSSTSFALLLDSLTGSFVFAEAACSFSSNTSFLALSSV